MSLGDLGQLEWVKEIRQKDSEILSQRGISHQQVHERIKAIIQKAKEMMALMPDEYNGIGVVKPKAPQVEVEGGIYKVIRSRKAQEDACPACEHTVTGPENFIIRNMKNDCELRATEIALHLLEKHRMFVHMAQYKMDPTIACKVLNF
jgi:hypothetical protein